MFAWLRRWTAARPAAPAIRAGGEAHAAVVEKAIARLDYAIGKRGVSAKAEWYLRDAVTFCMHTAAALDRSGDFRNAKKLRLRVRWTFHVLEGVDPDPPPYAALAMLLPNPRRV